SFRATLIPTVAIPVSILANFAIMSWLGFSVNILTMLALVLAIGVVVDDAIVVLENIHRHIEEGMTPMAAAFAGRKEITFAVIATTVALVAVFVPLAFQSSATGRLFVEFAIAIAGSVLISAFVALTLTPMMAGRVLKSVEAKPRGVLKLFESAMKGLARGYEALLGRLLGLGFGVRFLLLGGISAVILLATVWLYRNLEGDFLPEEDKGRLFCFVVAPEGSTPDYTDRMVKEMEGMLAATPEVDLYGAIVAPGFSGPGQGNSGIVFVKLKEERERSVQQVVNDPNGLRGQFFRDVEGAIAIPNIPKAIDRSFSSPFQLVLQGNDLESLNREATKLANLLRGLPYLQNVQSSFQVNKPELRLAIDRDRASALGVSVEDVSRTLQILFGGLDLAKIKRDGKEYDVIAQLERLSRATPQDLDRLYVRSAAGQLVQLSSVVTRNVGVAPNRIERFNRLRSATLSATPVGVSMGTAMERVEALLQGQIPDGMLYTWYGESRDLKDAGQEVAWVIALALVIVFMVLASQFESLVHPFTVMLTVPLAVVGALGGLWGVSWLVKMHLIPPVPAMNINLFSQIGVVLLIGLVTKNGILLVEFANQLRERGLAPSAAMVKAGAIRLRPILMTAISTVAGTLPIAIGFGAGAESRRPMGIAVVAGMVTSTVLTLVVIPMVYTLFSDLAAWVSGRQGATPAPAAPTAEPLPVK
ncbi:MAG: efflux RND transporter permease subunit, partial [Verrucomicrobiales bacterium]|nr:efflux RND transporter permease subunit [Verrucomicrobiales bacterium]